MLTFLPSENMYWVKPWFDGDYFGQDFGSLYFHSFLGYGGWDFVGDLAVEDILPCMEVGGY